MADNTLIRMFTKTKISHMSRIFDKKKSKKELYYQINLLKSLIKRLLAGVDIFSQIYTDFSGFLEILLELGLDDVLLTSRPLVKLDRVNNYGQYYGHNYLFFLITGTLFYLIYGYTFMLRSPIQTANQIRRRHENDRSNIFVTVYFVT